MPTAVAQMVPLGMLTRGSFKSPLSPNPAAIPVNAGKMKVNTSKKVKRRMVLPSGASKVSAIVPTGFKSGLPGPLPAKKSTSAANSRTTTRYNALTPRSAPLPIMSTVKKPITPKFTHMGSMWMPWATSAHKIKSRQATVNAMT